MRDPVLRQPVQLLEDVTKKQSQKQGRFASRPRGSSQPNLAGEMGKGKAKRERPKVRTRKSQLKLPVLSLSNVGSPKSPMGSSERLFSGGVVLPPTMDADGSKDQRLTLNSEVKWELASKFLQRAAAEKKQKMLTLVGENTSLLKEVQLIDDVFTAERIVNRNCEACSRTVRAGGATACYSPPSVSPSSSSISST